MNDHLEEEDLAAARQSQAEAQRRAARDSDSSQASYLGRDNPLDDDYYTNPPQGRAGESSSAPGPGVKDPSLGGAGNEGASEPDDDTFRKLSQRKASRSSSTSWSMVEEPASAERSFIGPANPGDDFEMIRMPATRMGGEHVLAHVPGPQAPRGFLSNAFGSSDGPASGRLLTRLGQGLLGDTNAGTPALIAGQAGYNYDAVGIGANLVGGTNNVGKAMGAFTPTMMRDVLRGFAVHAQLAGRQAVKDSGEAATDVAVPQRERYAQHAQLFREITERKREGEAVPKNMQGRELVHTTRAAQALGREIDYMGHRSEYEYTMQQAAGLSNRDALREKRPVPRAGELDPQGPAESDNDYAARLAEWQDLNKGAVRFVPRSDGPEMPVSTEGKFSVTPFFQTPGERRKGKLVQGVATSTTRAVDELGRILQNEEAGIDDLRAGNDKRAALKAALHSARGVGVGIGSALSGDPTGGMLAYPLIDAAGRLGGAGVSAIGQALGHVTGLEAGAQRQDDIDLHNTHYFGEAKQIRARERQAAALNPAHVGAGAGGAGAAPVDESTMDLVDDAQEARDEMVAPQPTARAQAVLERGLRFRETADEIGSERAGLPQLQTGNAATSFLGQRLGRGGFNHWLRDATTEPRILGGIVWPILRGLGRGVVAAGRGIGRGVMAGLRGIGNGWNRLFDRQRYEQEMAARRERQLAPLRDAGLIVDAPAPAPGDPAAGEAKTGLSLADMLAPEESKAPAAEGSKESTALEQQMQLLDEKSEDGGSQRGSQRGSQGNASARSATQLVDEPESLALDPMDKEAAEDQALRDKLRIAGDRSFWGRVGRDYVAGEVLGFGKRDIAGENIRAWHRHFKDRDIRAGQADHQKAKELDLEGHRRARALERERVIAKMEAMPGMKARMDQEEAVRREREEALRAGTAPRRQAVDLGAGPVVDDTKAVSRPASISSDGKSEDSVPDGNGIGGRDSGPLRFQQFVKQMMEQADDASDGGGPANVGQSLNVAVPKRAGSLRARTKPSIDNLVVGPGHDEAKVVDADHKTVSALSRSSRGGVDPALDDETKSAQSLRSGGSGDSESDIESQGTVDAAPVEQVIKAEGVVDPVRSDLDNGEDDVIRIRDEWDDDEDEVIRLGSDLDDDIPAQGMGDVGQGIGVPVVEEEAKSAQSVRSSVSSEAASVALSQGRVDGAPGSGGLIEEEAKSGQSVRSSVSSEAASVALSQGRVDGAPGSGGLIEEERKTLAGDDAASQSGAGVLLGSGAGAGGVSRTEYSQEPDRTFRAEDWRTGRSDRVVGKYGRTFGERKAVLGGGAGGFFGALFGQGMARANRRAEMRNYRQAQKAEGKQLREEQKEQLIAAHGSLDWRPQGIMRSQLANAGQIENLGDYPREPGVVYDRQMASTAHKGFMGLRGRFMNAGNEAGPGALNTGRLLFGARQADPGESELTAIEGEMRSAYKEYDQKVGNQTHFDARDQSTVTRADGTKAPSLDPKYAALVRANTRAGQDMAREAANPHQPRPRLRNAAGVEKRVRFMDGADDTVGLPVNDPAADITNKPMPTGVRFHPTPIGKRTFARELDARAARLAGSRQYVEADPQARKQLETALVDSHQARMKQYYRNESVGLETPNVGGLSDAEAMKQEAYAYPIRARLQRTSDNGLRSMYGERQDALAAGQPVDDTAVGDPEVLNHVILDRMEESRERESKYVSRAMPGPGLTAPMKGHAANQLVKNGVHEKVLRFARAGALSPGFFDGFLNEGKRIGRPQAQQPQSPPAQTAAQESKSAASDDEMNSMAGEGSLIEEELKEP